MFYLDFIGKDGKPRTKRIEQLGPDSFVFSDSAVVYKSFNSLIAAHQDPEGQPYLLECLPPSEYGKIIFRENI